jgi:drug/metabolite transporter superfamily protein YnfA
MHAIKVNFRDLSLRFVLGGASVALCFVLLQLIPSKSFAGVFAAFPAIMAASVVMAGYFENSEQASDIALGASAGMVGCTICVLTASYCMEHLNRWGLSLIISLFVWFLSSYATSQMIHIFLEKLLKKTKKAGERP